MIVNRMRDRLLVPGLDQRTKSEIRRRASEDAEKADVIVSEEVVRELFKLKPTKHQESSRKQTE